MSDQTLNITNLVLAVAQDRWRDLHKKAAAGELMEMSAKDFNLLLEIVGTERERRVQLQQEWHEAARKEVDQAIAEIQAEWDEDGSEAGYER